MGEKGAGYGPWKLTLLKISRKLSLLKASAKTHHDRTIKKEKNATQSAFLKTKPINKTAVHGIESGRPTPRLISQSLCFF